MWRLPLAVATANLDPLHFMSSTAAHSSCSTTPHSRPSSLQEFQCQQFDGIKTVTTMFAKLNKKYAKVTQISYFLALFAKK
jgi:hypothetical protein